MLNNVFFNSAQLVFRTRCYSCAAIFERMGHGLSRANERYRLMFTPNEPGYYPPGYVHSACPMWWNDNTHSRATVESRIYALLLAYEINRTGDL